MQAKVLVYKGKAKTKELLLELPAIVGRGSTVAVSIDHPVVSRRHCEIFEAGGVVKIRDLGSTNGTSVHGRKVAEAVLRPGDRFTIGSFTFVVEYECPAGATGGETRGRPAGDAAPASGRDKRSVAEEPPQGEESPDDFPRLGGECLSSDLGFDDAPPSGSMPGVATHLESEGAAPRKEMPKKRAAASARTAGFDRASDPNFEEMLDDFFDGLPGRDLEEFLRGIA